MAGVLMTWLTERFGLEVPVVSAPMAGAAGGRLAAAVSAAGALGMIGFSGAPEDLRSQAEVAGASGRPFGVGVLAWALEPGDERVFDIAAAAGAVMLSISYGDYARHVDRIKSAGMVCATQVGTVAEARQAADAGVDVIVARGAEGGGHGRGVVATLPLLQAVLDTVDAPVLAAGGIATARGVAAAVAAGAAGAWVGTAFLAAREADNSPSARSAVLDADLTDTIYTNVLDMGRGVPWPREFGGRAIRNEFATRWHGREDELLRTGERSDEPVVWAGEAAGLVVAERSAAEIVADLSQAGALLQAAAARVRERRVD
jgi:nitronate monooxygenase